MKDNHFSRENDTISEFTVHPFLPHLRKDRFNKKKKKTTPNLIQIVDQIHPLLNLLAASVSLTHMMLLQTPGWVVTNSPAMAGLLVPCFSQTRMNEPCLSPFPGSLSWEDKKNKLGHSLAL